MRLVPETEPSLRTWSGGSRVLVLRSPAVFQAIEVFSIAVFTVEYMVRLCLVESLPPTRSVRCAEGNARFRLMNMIDFLAIALLYIELISQGGGGQNARCATHLASSTRISSIQAREIFDGLQMFARVMAKGVGPAAAHIFLDYRSGALRIAHLLCGRRVRPPARWICSRRRYGARSRAPPFIHRGIVLVGADEHHNGWLAYVSDQFCWQNCWPHHVSGGYTALALPVSIIGANFSEIYREQKEEALKEQSGLMSMWKDLNKSRI